MNIRNIGATIRANKYLYNIYYYTFSTIIRCLGILVRRKSNQVLFVSFGGLKYDDSPKEIYLAMLKDKRFKKFNYIWAFLSPNEHDIPDGKKVKIDTIKYFYYLLSSKIWITNSSVERGLSLKRKGTIYLNTWHGTPIKKMGTDLSVSNESFASKGKNSWDIQLAQSKYEADIFSRVFNIPYEKFKIVGLPRNDRLANVHFEDILEARMRIGIPRDKKVILYAPTFREYEKDKSCNTIAKLHINIKKWEEKLGKEYILLLRAHYDVVKLLDFTASGFLINVSSYKNLNDLMIASDLLISDYSSIFFDYAILGRPMLCYAYDYDEYASKRGLYFDIRRALGAKINIFEDELIDEIRNISIEDREKITNDFKQKYVTEFGNASAQSIDIIYNLIKNHGN